MLGILINGKFSCFGPIQYLELKYGSGYKVTLKKDEFFQEKIFYDLFPVAIKLKDINKHNVTFQVIIFF